MISKTLETGWLSQRWKASHGFLKVRMLIGIIAATSALFFSCQETGKSQAMEQGSQKEGVKNDSLGEPKVNITVNRRYDDKGNVIGMDSTYSAYYSNIKGDTASMDSLFRSFDHYFSHNRSLYVDSAFNHLFFNDPFRYDDFFHDDYFKKRYELNDPYLRRMMDRMDSLKNKFYEEHRQRRNGADL